MGFTNTEDACANVFASGGGSFPTLTYSNVTIASTPTAGSTPSVNDFINAGYVIGKSGTTYTDTVLKTFAGHGPMPLKGQMPNIVSYLGYPIANKDYKTTPTGDYTSVITALIRDGNLISQTQLYNPADFKTPPAAGSASLIYLYQTMSHNTLSSAQTTEMDKLEQINLSFFATYLAEYCYYKRVYMFLLNSFFNVYYYNTYSSSGPDAGIDKIGGTAIKQDDTTAAIVTKKTANLNQIAYYLACINSRLTDLRGLLDAINKYYSNALTTITSQLESSGTTFGSQQDVEARVNALKNSSNKLDTLRSEADYRKGIVEYTAEKNRYSNILLGLYAFLNLAAIGVILNLRD